ncbi:MAG: TolC family protein [Rikenellaceae bacterium]
MKKTILGLTLLLICFVANAQDTLRLDLVSAVELAIDDNPTIKIAGQEIERQDYVRKETVGYLLPNLSASGQYLYNLQTSVMYLPDGIFGEGTGGAMRFGYANSYTGGFTLSLPLYAPALYATLQLNREQMEQAVESARSSKIELAASVKKSYYTVLLAQSSLELIQENMSLAQDVVDDSRAAYEQGVMSQYDLTTSEVQLSSLTPTFYQAQSALHNARLMLNMLLGLPLDMAVSLDEDLTDFSEFINEENSHVVDLSGNADLNLLDIQLKMLDTQLRIQKTAKLPTLAAFGSYQVLTQSDDFNIGSYDWSGTSYVGLQLDIPIFSGLSNVNKERQIKNQKTQLETQKDYAEQGLLVELQASISNIESAKSQMEANEISKEQAADGYRISLVRYETGQGTIVELNSAQVQLIQADMNYRQSIYDYMTAQADYEKIIGVNF